MAKPCAVFWDIQNVGIPKGQSVNSIIELIRSTIIKPHNLDEIFFFCVCDVQKLPLNVGNSLINLDVDIVQAYNEVKDSADIKIMDLMRKFVKVAGKDCTIILLSGDADYCGTLSDLKKLHNVSIHLIRLADSFSSKLDQIADYTFMLTDGVLKPIKATGNPMYFISVKNYPLTMDIKFVMDTLNGQIAGSIQKSAFLFCDSICIGFPTLWSAEKAIEQLNGSRFHGHFLKAELLLESPLTEILKCIKPNVTMQTKGNNEVKQLTFIKMSNSNEADISKVIKFCMACTAQSSSQCILSRKPFLWIVFSFKSDAQDCLPKVQIMYPDAAISAPPIDLTSKYHENSYTVESCRQKATDSTSRVDNAAKPKPEKDVQASSQNQSSSNDFYASIGPSVDIKTQAAKESVTLKKTMNSEPRIVSMNFCDDNDLNIFYRCDNSFSHVPQYQPTRWSLLYNLFEKLYDLGAKKVIFDGNIYCAHFDSVSTYQHAFTEKRIRYFKPLEFVSAEDLSKKFTKQLDRYIHEIPWCLNIELDIHCLVVKVNAQIPIEFKELCKNFLGNRECIFIKLFLGEFWIGFPDELTCNNCEETVVGFMKIRGYKINISTAKPSNKFLESIDFHDLAGDAYDLAFLSSQLESSKQITRPRIIEQISLQQMMKKQEFNETVFNINVKGNFRNWVSWVELLPRQIVKILVNYSKVIPLAATGSYDEVNFMFKTWYEAHTARQFINKLSSSEVPYFTLFNGASEVQKQQLAFPSIFKYYLINDERKVLEKIVQKEIYIMVDRLHPNSTTDQSTSHIDLLDEGIMKKLQYLYIITANSGFKFTSGMISIIKLNLVSMDCPVYIEFEDKIWVAADDLEKGNKAKVRIEKIKFKMLHENDGYDFEVGVEMQSAPSSPTIVANMLANKLIKTTKPASSNMHVYSMSVAVPLGHFNYNYRKAARMTLSKYCQLNALDRS